MKNLLMFLGVLTFVTQAYCKQKDAILKIENESTYDIAIAISPRLNKENHSDSVHPYFAQGLVARMNSGDELVLKQSQLGQKGGTKEGDITSFKIGIVSFANENSYIIPKEFSPDSKIRLTNEYIRKFLGINK
jgi:hypothetical protein